MPFAQAKKKRYGVVKAVLVIVLIGIVAGTGWYVYRVKQNTTKLDKSTATTADFKHRSPSSSVTSKSQIVTTTSAICPSFTTTSLTPPDMKTYTSYRYEYRIAYPATWAEVKNGGSLNNLPILDGLLFTPPGNQGPLYDIYVFKESLSSAETSWETAISDGSYNSAGQASSSKESVLSVTNCTYQGFPAAEIVTKQNVGAIGVNYDIEFDVSAHNYLYDFSTRFNWSSTTLSNSTNPSVGDVLSVAESLHIY